MKKIFLAVLCAVVFCLIFFIKKKETTCDNCFTVASSGLPISQNDDFKLQIKIFEKQNNVKVKFLELSKSIMLESSLPNLKADMVIGIHNIMNRQNMVQYLSFFDKKMFKNDDIGYDFSDVLDGYFMPIAYNYILFLNSKGMIFDIENDYNRLKYGKKKVILEDPRVSATGKMLLLFINFISNKEDDSNVIAVLDDRVLTSGFFMAYNLFKKRYGSLLCAYATTVALYNKQNIFNIRLVDYMEKKVLNNNRLRLPIFVYYASILKNGQKNLSYKFIKMIIGKECQNIIQNKLNEISIRKSIRSDFDMGIKPIFFSGANYNLVNDFAKRG